VERPPNRSYTDLTAGIVWADILADMARDIAGDDDLRDAA
jgi:hypothetical protein